MQTLQLWTDACDERAQTLAETLVHVDVRGRDTEEELQDER